MKAFITGGAGFIGSSLAAKLLADPSNYVTVYDNFTLGKTEYLQAFANYRRLKIVAADVLDGESLAGALEGHDIVYHFSSNPDIAVGIENPTVDYRQSIEATFTLLQAMRITRVRRLVFTSGSGIYGDVKGLPTAENFGPLLPVSMYGAGKLAAEALISAFSSMYEVQSFIFRMANVVGGKQTHGVILDFVNKLKSNPRELLVLGNGTQSKSFIHIDDVLDAFEFVLGRAADRVNVFNVATDDFMTVNEIARVVIDLMRLSAVDFKYTGTAGGWPGDVPVVRIDAQKLFDLGWKPKLNSREAVSKAAADILAGMETAAGQRSQ